MERLLGIVMAGCVFASTAMALPINERAKISPQLQQELKKTAKPRSVLVYMQEQASLQDAEFLNTKEEKGRFVFQALRDTAQSSQADLSKWLSEQKLSYRNYYIDNVILVYKPSKAQIRAIAALRCDARQRQPAFPWTLATPE